MSATTTAARAGRELNGTATVHSQQARHEQPSKTETPHLIQNAPMHSWRALRPELVLLYASRASREGRGEPACEDKRQLRSEQQSKNVDAKQHARTEATQPQAVVLAKGGLRRTAHGA
jgi:hypothetical protein